MKTIAIIFTFIAAFIMPMPANADTNATLKVVSYGTGCKAGESFFFVELRNVSDTYASGEYSYSNKNGVGFGNFSYVPEKSSTIIDDAVTGKSVRVKIWNGPESNKDIVFNERLRLQNCS